VVQVAAALRRAPKWGAVAVECPLDGTDSARRPDLCATEAGTGAVTWGDASVACPWPDSVAAPVRLSPLRPATALAREAVKHRTYVPALPATNTPYAFTPLVWESLGRIGPATDTWLKTTLAVPQLAAVRAGLLLEISVALWRSLACEVAGGYSHALAHVEDFGGVKSRDSDAHDALAWSGGEFRLPGFLRGATDQRADSGPLACLISD